MHRPTAPDPGEGFLLIAVGTPGAREWIEGRFDQHGLRRWEHYLAVA